jgi:hypothetical protein
MAYVPAMIAGFLAMAPAAILGEKKNIPKQYHFSFLSYFS